MISFTDRSRSLELEPSVGYIPVTLSCLFAVTILVHVSLYIILYITTQHSTKVPTYMLCTTTDTKPVLGMRKIIMVCLASLCAHSTLFGSLCCLFHLYSSCSLQDYDHSRFTFVLAQRCRILACPHMLNFTTNG